MTPAKEILPSIITRDLAPQQDYYAVRALSNSGMKHLAVSPLRYWYLHVNPDRPEDEETKFMRKGSALHCAVLEPAEFEKRYTCELLQPEGVCLSTMEDIRTWLRDKGLTPKGTKKADIINQAAAVDPNVFILDVELLKHETAHRDKEILKLEEWNQVRGMADALLAEPKLQVLLKEGRAEVPLFAKDPKLGIPLKAKLDWVTPLLTLDLKTFSQKRGKSIDESVADAIWYERYYRQAYFYSMLRALVAGDKTISGPQTAPDFIMAFVESEPPHEVRLRALRPKTAGQPNDYWGRARNETEAAIWLYGDCMKRFGNAPWREHRTLDPLLDEEMKGLAFS